MTTRAVLPIKDFVNAKQRLATILDVDERAGLCRAMVEDVLLAVEACPLIDDIALVTNDEIATELGRQFHAEIIAEPPEKGLIPAVQHAASSLAAAGVDRMIFLPGDVPLVTPDELEVVLDGFAERVGGICLVPASDLGGTNCLVASPPDCLTFQFGINSFRKHVAEAGAIGVSPIVLKLPGLGLDIDTPQDLNELMTRLAFQGSESHTYRYCVEIDVVGRLAPVIGGED
ncbi:MAG: 2-phospho-L-lactate guanylyltransferase [Pseudomonadales bacterium]